jgi:NADH-quinone oxidoreductase subunit N
VNSIINLTDIFAISPLLLLLGGGLILILLESFFPATAKKVAAIVTLTTLVLALAAAFWGPADDNPYFTRWLYFDPLARFFSVLFLGIGIATTLLSLPFFKQFDASPSEYFFLMLSALFGLILIGSAADFLTLFIGLETLSIALYILCGYIKRWTRSREASTKYFLMGALAASFLLYGIALLYGATGTTRFSELLSGYHGLTTAADKTLFFGGIAFITVGIAFKAAIVPLHLWAPDVYDGAPTPVTAFMAVATKIGAFAAFIRIFMQAIPEFSPIWSQSIALLAYPTLIYANYVALRQTQLRRFFAYSGISHAGFLLIPLAAGGENALTALLFYFVIYALATLGCFAVLAFLDKKEEGVMFDDLNGLYSRSPLLALFFSFGLLTLAGIPPTAGFLAKFYVFKVAFEAGFYGLVIVGLLTTILSAFYYLRLIGLMFSKEPLADGASAKHSFPAMSVATFCLVALVALSVYPEPIFALLKNVARY